MWFTRYEKLAPTFCKHKVVEFFNLEREEILGMNPPEYVLKGEGWCIFCACYVKVYEHVPRMSSAYIDKLWKGKNKK